LEFVWIFKGKNHFKINISHILNPNFAKYNPLNPPHEDLSNNTKGTFQFLQDFQLRFNLICSEEIIQYSRTFAPQVQTSWNQAMHPSSSWSACQRHQEQHLKHPGSVDLITTKQNKTNNFLHR
jgi:hypothetical protein